MFHFKQFTVDQANCAMKINTDGVLLGAMAGADKVDTILDIGTGTGVIALMMAQRFPNAKVDAVEIDADAARTAYNNFIASPFADRLNLFATNFETFFRENPDSRYDLIVSNPPFYVASLKSPGEKKSLAKHADMDFFERLIETIAAHLTSEGSCWLILPVDLAEGIIALADEHHLSMTSKVKVKSYPDSTHHRLIMNLSLVKRLCGSAEMTIYLTKDVYSEGYKKLLQPYFIAF